jgi:hypothetical protein
VRCQTEFHASVVLITTSSGYICPLRSEVEIQSGVHVEP